jgi:type I restriction enzyme M protein
MSMRGVRRDALAPGLPRISDGQLLFLLHMLHTCAAARRRRHTHRDHYEWIAALYRRCRQRRERDPPLHVLENDWLEALIALPEQLFYNTGIATYIWVLSNRKPAARRGR